MTSNEKTILAVVAIAAVAGAVAYILSDSGTDIRNQIKDKSKKLADNLEDVVGKAKKKYGKSYEHIL
jgi:archaellum component FlaG (FlaF/FlaG flagellin family)